MENILTQKNVRQMMDENPSMKEHFVIPEGVTKIGDEAFFRCENLKSIDIPEGATEIGDGAFWGCENLKSINIPEGVTKIRNGAFGGCESLQSIIIPDSVTEIGNEAFFGCNNLKEITAPEHLTQALNKEITNYKRLYPNFKNVRINSSNSSLSEEKNSDILTKSNAIGYLAMIAKAKCDYEKELDKYNNISAIRRLFSRKPKEPYKGIDFDFVCNSFRNLCTKDEISYVKGDDYYEKINTVENLEIKLQGKDPVIVLNSKVYSSRYDTPDSPLINKTRYSSQSTYHIIAWDDFGKDGKIALSEHFDVNPTVEGRILAMEKSLQKDTHIFTGVSESFRHILSDNHLFKEIVTNLVNASKQSNEWYFDRDAKEVIDSTTLYRARALSDANIIPLAYDLVSSPKESSLSEIIEHMKSMRDIDVTVSHMVEDPFEDAWQDKCSDLASLLCSRDNRWGSFEEFQESVIQRFNEYGVNLAPSEYIIDKAKEALNKQVGTPDKPVVKESKGFTQHK